MNKLLGVIVLSTLLLLTSSKLVSASLLVIDKSGELEWKVLSYEDELVLSAPETSSLDVTNINDQNTTGSSKISLHRDNDKISMLVTTGNETKDLDVTSIKDDLVEIEDRPQVKKIRIGIIDNKFSLYQRGITALTEFPVIIDSKSAKLSLTTSSGNEYLSIYPYDAVETLIKANIISRIPENKIEIFQDDSGLQYKVAGEKVFNIFDLYEYKIPVTTNISALTGEIVSLDGPGWFKFINFLMS